MLAAIPSVYYVVPNLYRSSINPVQLSFDGLAKVAIFPAPKSSIDKVRSIFGRKQMRTEGALGFSVMTRSTHTRIASLGASMVARHIFDKMKLAGSTSKFLQPPDLIFVYDVFHHILDLDKFPCPRAYFVGDASISVDRYFELARVQDYDYVFVAQKDYISVFKSRGCTNVFWLPFGFDPNLFFGPRKEEYDFCFIGNPYWHHARGRILHYLKEQTRQFRSYIGKTPDMGALLRRSRIALQISVGGALGQRIFETLGAGPLLIADRISNGLSDLFEENVHLACYSNERELVEKIIYFLEHDEERQQIAKKGQIEALSRHTVTHRANHILETCLGRDMSSFARERFPWFREDFLRSLL